MKTYFTKEENEFSFNKRGRQKLGVLFLLGGVALGSSLLAVFIANRGKHGEHRGVSSDEDAYEYADMIGI